MKFRFKHEDPKEHRIFEGKTARDGDIVEYEGFFADKALSDPKHFTPYKEPETAVEASEAPKKRRRKVSGNKG